MAAPTDLFSPLTFRSGHTIANRLALAPMTTQQSHDDGTPSDDDVRWYGALADDGYGLVFTCGVSVSRRSIAFPRQLSFGSDAHLPALRALFAPLWSRSTRPSRPLWVVQLMHGGARGQPALCGAPNQSASAYVQHTPGFVVPEPMSVDDIHGVVDDFAAAAGRAVDVGADGVEVHGANGYLFTQFLSTVSNTRADDYGGSVMNRARFLRETVRAVRARVGPHKIVGVRLSVEDLPYLGGLDIDDNIAVARALVEDGVDYVHLSLWARGARSVKHPHTTVLAHVRAGLPAEVPLLCAGGVVDVADADALVADGADVVAIGRAAIGNAHVPAAFRARAPLAQMPFAPATLRERVGPGFLRYLAGPMAARAIVASS